MNQKKNDFLDESTAAQRHTGTTSKDWERKGYNKSLSNEDLKHNKKFGEEWIKDPESVASRNSRAKDQLDKAKKAFGSNYDKKMYLNKAAHKGALGANNAEMKRRGIKEACEYILSILDED